MAEAVDFKNATKAQRPNSAGMENIYRLSNGLWAYESDIVNRSIDVEMSDADVAKDGWNPVFSD